MNGARHGGMDNIFSCSEEYYGLRALGFRAAGALVSVIERVSQDWAGFAGLRVSLDQRYASLKAQAVHCSLPGFRKFRGCRTLSRSVVLQRYGLEDAGVQSPALLFYKIPSAAKGPLLSLNGIGLGIFGLGF